MVFKCLKSKKLSLLYSLVCLLLASPAVHAKSVTNLCVKLFNGDYISPEDQLGAQFLHQQYSNLVQSKAVKVNSDISALRDVKLQRPDERIGSWLKTLERIARRAEYDTAALERLKKAYYKLHVIRYEDIPETYYKLQVQIAKEQGHGNIKLDGKKRKQLADILISNQKKSLDHWIEYLVSKDSSMYPMWIKFWSFQGMVKLSKWNSETGQFGARDKGQVTTFPELNREAYAMVVDAVVKKVNKKSLSEIQDSKFLSLLEGSNFGKLYGRVLLNFATQIKEVNNSVNGEWVVYKQDTDHMPLVRSLSGKNTGWCTAAESTAELQLSAGDFHVYYSLDQNKKPTIPRIAIRMEGEEIAEIRGIESNQHLDSGIAATTILTEKLSEFGAEGEAYIKKSNDMRMLTQIDNRHSEYLAQKMKEDGAITNGSIFRRLYNKFKYRNSGADFQMSAEELTFINEFNGKIQGFGYSEDPRIAKITAGRNVKKDLATILNIKEEEITTSESAAVRGGIKYFYGNLDLSKKSMRVVSFPEKLENLTINYIENPHLKNMELPKSVKRLVLIFDLQESVQKITLPDSAVSIEIYGGQIKEELVLPKNLESLALSEKAPLQSLPSSLKSLRLMELKTLGHIELPQNLVSLELPNLVNADGIRFPPKITHLDLPDLVSIKNTVLPENLKYLELENIKSVKDLVLPSKLETLILPEVKSIDGLILPSTLKSLEIDNVKSIKGLVLPDSLEVLLIRSVSKSSLKGIKFPKFMREIRYEEGGAFNININSHVNGD